MESAILRFSVEDGAFDQVMALLPASRIERSWRSGEARGRGVHELSGANVLIAESANVRDLAIRAVRLIRAKHSVFCEMRDLGARMELDFSVCPDPDQFSVGMKVEAQDLALLGATGIALVVSVYGPNEDEKDPLMPSSAADEPKDDAKESDDGESDDSEGK
jgi:hypothetical protein